MRIKQRGVSSLLPSLSDYPAVLQRIYASRGIKDASQLDKSLQALLPFNSLTDIEKASLRLEQALRAKERILIIGDFDADGATSTTLAISALRVMGASHVEFLVPNRFDFGYGLTPAIIEVAKKWQPHLIITVDNGIASIDGVDAANALGIDVLITDHHLPAEELPKACAIVNPNQVGDLFPSKSIAGVGVIFYVMLALRRQLIKSNWFEQRGLAEPNMAQFLDLVALGTIADVVSLDQNNRIMVNQGLARIRQSQCRPGIKALIEIAGRDCSRLRESDLGFSVAPRLNAAGRLDDMSLGIECLLSDNMEKAHTLASHLDELNQERRVIEAEMKEQAMLAVDKLAKKIEHSNHLPAALCLVDPSWHQGVIGILAGRLKERYHRPIIAFAKVSETELKGSARSVAGLNIRDALAAVDKDHPGLITKFGGHAMAAGLSLSPQCFTDFQQAFITEVSKHIDASECEGELWTDGSLTSQELSLETATLLQQAGPWGQQFPEPCFDNIFEVLDQRLVGQHHLKITLAHPEGGVFDAIAFNVDVKLWPNYRARQVHAAYKLDINSYQGRTRLQLVIEALQVYN
ncbi:single-stranded-DNA-specific exonuclease RecJ [Legionella brunensis]|uniref:Single-stranded-DNA-specific exonuclease RecJ n=1 Tax=Legionella brunensis TaxID=29422 RepID=A0A0W0STU4_9GAMM|nr:single-stranded-DNA-specific exonuclease RecJ [Legionella brunensis]KTC86792.1 single-stranded-DNA-specific exonuclease RecJ [Legionella brunensis]